MTKFIWIRLGIAAFFFLLILIGRWISPVEELNNYALDAMSFGKWVTVSGAVGFIGAVAYSLGQWLKKDKAPAKT